MSAGGCSRGRQQGENHEATFVEGDAYGDHRIGVDVYALRTRTRTCDRARSSGAGAGGAADGPCRHEGAGRVPSQSPHSRGGHRSGYKEQRIRDVLYEPGIGVVP